jgi:hypothetical protein
MTPRGGPHRATRPITTGERPGDHGDAMRNPFAKPTLTGLAKTCG